MTYTQNLSTVKEGDSTLVGRRAADLSLLAKGKFRIPESAVILSTAFEYILEKGLKHKLDFLLKHAHSPQSMMNVYTGVRKAIKEIDLGKMENEFQEFYESISATKMGLGNQRRKLRILVSPNYTPDPENNDTVIQNIRNWSEFLVAVREAWALAYVPSQLSERRAGDFPESKLKIALLVQVMEEPTLSVHAHSALPEDEKKTYLEVYYGSLDLRGKIRKDFYAVDTEHLKIVSSETRRQPEQLVVQDGELVTAELSRRSADDKIAPRNVEEIARLTKKASKTLQSPVKLFFTTNDETHTLLWANRYTLEASTVEIVDIESEGMPETDIHIRETEEMPEEEIEAETTEDTSTPEAQAGHAEHAAEEALKDAAAHAHKVEEEIAHEQEKTTSDPTQKLLASSLKLALRTIEHRYERLFGQEGDDFVEMIGQLNARSIFSRKIDASIIQAVHDAVHNGKSISADEYAEAVEEISVLISEA